MSEKICASIPSWIESLTELTSQIRCSLRSVIWYTRPTSRLRREENCWLYAWGHTAHGTKPDFTQQSARILQPQLRYDTVLAGREHSHSRARTTIPTVSTAWHCEAANLALPRPYPNSSHPILYFTQITILNIQFEFSAAVPTVLHPPQGLFVLLLEASGAQLHELAHVSRCCTHAWSNGT